MPGDRCRLGAGCVNGASPVLRGFKVSIEYASRPRAPDGKPVGNGEKIVYAKPERLCSTRPKGASRAVRQWSSLSRGPVNADVRRRK